MSVLKKITTKTGPSADDELNAATFEVELCSKGKCCTIDYLDNVPRDDFKANAEDSFSGDDLKDCQGFEYEECELDVQVFVNGVDRWGGYYVELESENGRTVKCLENYKNELFYLRRGIDHKLECAYGK